MSRQSFKLCLATAAQPHLLAATTVNEDAAAVGLATTSLRNAYSIQKSVTLKLLHLLPCAS